MKVPVSKNATDRQVSPESAADRSVNDRARARQALESLIDSDKTTLGVLLASRLDPDGPFDPEWHATYLQAINEFVRKILQSDELVAPLRDIVTHLFRADGPAPVAAVNQHEVAFIHAFAAAEISYLIFTGTDEQTAAQQVARRLIGHNVPLPGSGGDSRGWVRLLKWRAALKHKRYPSIVFEQYEARFEELKEGGD